MAHGPVNRTYRLSINNNPALTYRVKETDYQTAKNEPNCLILIVVAGSKTQYTALLSTGQPVGEYIPELENDGYTLSKGRTFVKFIAQDVVYDE